MYSLTVHGERCSDSAISRLVAPEAMSSRTSCSRSERRLAGGSSTSRKTVIPRPIMCTASAISWAGHSLGTKPEAPAARAALGEIRPAPEMSRTRVAGDCSRRRSQISAPDSSPMNRSTSATCGSKRSASAAASAPLRALRQRSTQGCSVSMRRKPQWTTSWSSTTRTRRRRCAPSAGIRTGRTLMGVPPTLIGVPPTVIGVPPGRGRAGARATHRCRTARTRSRRRSAAPRRRRAAAPCPSAASYRRPRRR